MVVNLFLPPRPPAPLPQPNSVYRLLFEKQLRQVPENKPATLQFLQSLLILVLGIFRSYPWLPPVKIKITSENL